MKLKNLLNKAGAILPAIAFAFATFSANATCSHYIYQEKAPKKLDEIRKYK